MAYGADLLRRVRDSLSIGSARLRVDHELMVGTGQADPLGVAGDASPEQPGGAIGATGTLNIWGYITGEDYNSDVDGYNAFPFYNKMRLSDAQVHASLMQIKLPLKAARKTIKPATDDNEDRARADFVSALLLGDQAMARSFEQVLDHALLRFDFGCSGEEIVWTLGEATSGQVAQEPVAAALWGGRHPSDLTRNPDGTVELSHHAAPALLARGVQPFLRIKDLAPRLPRTFYRWILNDTGPETGTLKYLQQFAPNANGRYGFYNIPSDRLALHTHLREGDNFYGRSILRAAYPNWFWKQQLYRIDAIRHDRLGAGIFIAKLGEKYNSKSAPLDKLEETLKGLRSHEKAYAVVPFGVELDLLAPKSSQGMATDLIQSIEHHNVMIAQNVLQQFSTQGQQKHGSFSGAKVSSEAFFDALEGQAVEIAAEFDRVIRLLCDANFDMKGRGYPRFAFADIATADVSAIADNLNKLAMAKVITPEDDLENWARDLLDAPALPEKMKGRDRTPPAPVPFGGGAPHPTPTNPAEPNHHPTAVSASTRAPFMEDGRKFGRVPTPRERKVLDLHGIPSTLDDMTTRLARTMADIRRAQLKTLAAKLAQKDGRKTGAFTDIRHQHLPIPQVAEMTAAIREAQTKALDYGRQTVRDELARQGADVKDLATAGENKRTANSALVSSARITAKKQAENWRARIMDEGLRIRRTGVQDTELEKRIVDGLDDEVDSGAKRDAAQEMHEAFGIGRDAEAREQSDLIETAEYSAILDVNTCDTCADLDGEEFEVDSADYNAVLPPNPNCDGRDSCRCVMLYLTAGEAT